MTSICECYSCRGIDTYCECEYEYDNEGKYCSYRCARCRVALGEVCNCLYDENALRRTFTCDLCKSLNEQISYQLCKKSYEQTAE